MTLNQQDIIDISKEWIRSFVIGLGLCPFAQKPFDAGQVRFSISDQSSVEKILRKFWDEIEILDNHSPGEISNTFLILPNSGADFRAFFDLINMAEQLMLEQEKINDYQLVAFHPKFQFAESRPEEAGNHVNQSPYPMIHILREKEVTEAISLYGDTSKISLQNRKIMEERGRNLA